MTLKLTLVCWFAFQLALVDRESFAGVNIDLTETRSYKFEFLQEKNDKSNVTNFFIRELAKFNLSTLRNTGFTYHYSIRRALREIEPNTFEVTLQLGSEKCTGDIYYRNFDISDILMPEMADLRIIIVDRGNYFLLKELSSNPIDENGMLSTSFVFEGINPDNDYTILIDKIAFYSGESDKQLFYERVSNIDAYYTSISAMNRILEDIKLINFRVSFITENYLKLQEYERIYHQIATSPFTTKLNIETHDVAGFHNKLKELSIELDNCKERLFVVLNTQEYIEYDKLISELAVIYVEEVSKFLVLSQDVTHSQQEYFYNLGHIDYNSALLAGLKKGLFQILTKTKYCNDTDFVYDKLKNEIYVAFLEKAKMLIGAEQFHTAKGVLLNAESFYSVAIGKRLPLEMNILLSKANYGIYNSYLHLIDRSIEIGNYDLAENYIEKAKVFQADNSSTIISNKYIKQVSEELVKLYINKGYALTQEQEYEESIYCFEQAQRICISIGQFNYDYVIKHGLIQARNEYYLQLIGLADVNLKNGNENLAKSQLEQAMELTHTYPTQIAVSPDFKRIKSEIDYQVYLKDISEGKKFLSQGNYNMAYDRLLHALELEEQSDFSIYEPLPEIFAQAATSYLVEQCQVAEIKVNKYQLDEAKVIYDRCFNLQALYGLNYEPNLQSSLALLNNNIFMKRCELANEDFEEIIAQFQNLVESGAFVQAMEELTLTREITAKNYYCEFDHTKVAILEAKYKPAADYQELAEKAQEALQNDDKERFIELYNEMEQLSESYEVIRQRIEPMPLHYLFSIKKNLAFLETSINNYKSEEEFETALKILQTLQANNYSGKDTKSIQQKLAMKLATADKASADLGDPRDEVEKYTGGDSYFKHFRKTYIKSR